MTDQHGDGREPARFQLDLLEHGGPLRGRPQSLDRRLFVQLHVFTGCLDPVPLERLLHGSGLDAVLYLSATDPRGIGVAILSEIPEVFTREARTVLTEPAFAALTPLPDFTMFGRTYATGREPDLEDWLLRKVRRAALDPSNRWAVWYPLRRTGAFNSLPREEQGRIMAEHATIGRAYGEAGRAQDIRLECHGLDRDDNEFVIGLVGADLFPLSRLVKDMRPTKQTSEYIEKMGPFFIGTPSWQAPIRQDR